MTERTGNGWCTPEWLLDLVREMGPIKLDPCTHRDNPTKAEYIRTIDCDPDGLETYWSDFEGLVYCNPPYGRGHMQVWSKKIYREANSGCEIVALTRGDTSTKWAHDMLLWCNAVCFPPRIKFVGAKGSPNFANMIFYFGPREDLFRNTFRNIGPVMTPRNP